MARNKGMFQFAANFEIKNAAALDPRIVVDTKSELYDKQTWPSDGNTVYLYNGLVVSVVEENELYMLIDSVNFSSESSWKKIAVKPESNDSYINVTSNNKIGLNFETLRADLQIPVNLTEEVAKLTAVIGTSQKGLVKDVADNIIKIGVLESTLKDKVDTSIFNNFKAIVLQHTSDIESLEESVENNITRIGVLENKVDVDSVSEAISNAIASFKIKGLVGGNNITITETEDPGIVKIGISNLTANDIFYAENVTLKNKLDELSVIKSGIVEITAGSGITINSSVSTTPVVGIKVKTGSSIVAKEDGLDIIWKEFNN